MGIFSRKRPKVEDRTPGSSYAFFMGSSSAGKNVNERSAMQMTAVYACVRILSEAIASLPLHVYELGKNENKQIALKTIFLLDFRIKITNNHHNLSYLIL